MTFRTLGCSQENGDEVNYVVVFWFYDFRRLEPELAKGAEQSGGNGSTEMLPHG